MNQTESEHGRVEADGTVYVRTREGERMVGQVPDASPEEAMSFFVRRFEALETEVSLLEQRVAAGSLTPAEARKTIATLQTSISEANAVGDLDALIDRLNALTPTLEAQEEARRAEKSQAAADAREAKEAMVAEAETLAEGTDWRGGVNRFRALLEQWKALPRLDRGTDDQLWHRFSAARTTYTRRRKAHFAEQASQRADAQQVKEQIIREAEPLATSTDWGPTSGAFRDLMARWKAAGPAPRDIDNQLWTRFRALQDEFFNARNAANNAQDTEFAANLSAREELLAQAESTVLPVTDLAASRAAYREFVEKYNEIGKVPRDAVRPLAARVTAIERALKEAEDAEWQRTDPAARQRATETVETFSTQIARLTDQADAADKAGNTKKATELRASIATYTEWLDQARATLADFEA